MSLERPAPAGDVFDVRTHVGALLVIEPLEDVPPMVTKASTEPVPSVRCNIYVIGPPGQVVEEYQSALLFQRLLWARLRQSIGKQVCGILTGQPGVTQNGRNVPYDLTDPPDAAFEAANRAMMARPKPQQPADPWATQQAPPGWGAPAAATTSPWEAAPAQQAPAQPTTPWGAAQPAQPSGGGWQQQIPRPPQPEDRPPWETEAPAGAPPWGAGRQ